MSAFLELFRMIKFEHTIFALPFALLGAIVASAGWPEFSKILWVILAATGARTSAMSFNRIVDKPIDALNPRTAERSLPAMRLSTTSALVFMLLGIVVMFLAAYALNPLCLRLAPLALVILLGYSFTKRFTWLCHFFLGLSLALAPLGGWIAITGSVSLPIIYLALGVGLWAAGFDIIYALQDEIFDKAHGLFSVPAAFGGSVSLWLSRACHTGAILSWGIYLILIEGIWTEMLGLAFITLILLREQWLVRNQDLSKVDEAFFLMNSFVGPIFLVATATKYLLY